MNLLNTMVKFTSYKSKVTVPYSNTNLEIWVYYHSPFLNLGSVRGPKNSNLTLLIGELGTSCPIDNEQGTDHKDAALVVFDSLASPAFSA